MFRLSLGSVHFLNGYVCDYENWLVMTSRWVSSAVIVCWPHYVCVCVCVSILRVCLGVKM